MHAIRKDPFGFRRFLDSSESWGKTQQDLERYCEVLAQCVMPQCIYEIGLSRVSLSTGSRAAKESYVQRSPVLAHNRHCEEFLDILWRYKVEAIMLRPEALDVATIPDTHRHRTHLVSEQCKYIGIKPSTKPRVTEMYHSHKFY
jgi:hypothetical protein